MIVGAVWCGGNNGGGGRFLRVPFGPAERCFRRPAIDFACGPQGGADCTAILQGGGCYNPNTIAAHCSWAANSYYQNNKARGATCDFGGAATVSTTDPSTSSCSAYLFCSVEQQQLRIILNS